MTGFWRNWMTGWCWASIAFGLLVTGAALPATDGPMRALLATMRGEPVALDAPLRFAWGLAGAVTMGWGTTLLVATRAADRLGPEVWRGLTASVLLWFVVDSLLSVATGFPLNAVSNAVFAAGYLLPVLASRVLARQDGAPVPRSSARV